MYKVFVYGKPVYLTDNLQFFQQVEHTTKSVFTNSIALKELLKKLRLSKINHEWVIYAFDLADLWLNFTSLYKVIDAAGGLIQNKKGEFLFIFRRGKWDLPKGKIDFGETIAEGAVREVKEECGLQEVILGKMLKQTYHTYTEGNKRVLKITYWYEMDVPGNQKLIPQLEEDITDIKWIKRSQLNEIKKNTYKSVADLINEYILLEVPTE